MQDEQSPVKAARVPQDTPGEPVLADKGRDLAATRDVLARWLEDRLGSSDVTVSGLHYPTGAGASNETVLFEAAWSGDHSTLQRDLVLRVEPTVHQLFLDPAFRQQFELLKVLASEALVKVPEVLWFEDDPDVLGGRFFVMSRLCGRVPVSNPVYNAVGWLHDATPAQRRQMWEGAMGELARIHTVPLDRIDMLDRPELGPTGLEQKLEYWRRTMDFATGGRTPDWLAAIHEWLLANLPVERPDGLGWGDARIGNMMFDEDFCLVGVMDWEQAMLSGGRRDLGWWLFFDEIHSTEQGVTRLDGLGGREETIQLWEELTGETAGDLRWYEILTGFEVVQLTLRSGLLRGASADAAIAENPFYRRLQRLLDH